MTEKEFACVLEWYMCSDPWPVPGEPGIDNQQSIDEMLNKLALSFGFSDWVSTYHKLV
jgi:hypothetical protein